VLRMRMADYRNANSCRAAGTIDDRLQLAGRTTERQFFGLRYLVHKLHD